MRVAAGRRGPRQEPADLRRERAALDKVQRGVALVVEGMEEAPDEYRRAFALVLALTRLAEAARSDMTKAMLRAASRGDMDAASVPAFIQAAMDRVAKASPA